MRCRAGSFYRWTSERRNEEAERERDIKGRKREKDAFFFYVGTIVGSWSSVLLGTHSVTYLRIVFLKTAG